MPYLEIVLIAVGLIALVIGYRKNHRNLLVCAALMLFVASGANDFMRGFQNGLQEGTSAGVTHK